MNKPERIQLPEEIHPSVWRASQLARAAANFVDTGHGELSRELGGGWPKGALTDLLVQQPGIGEVRLLAPALKSVAHRKIIMLQPPHVPQAIGLAALGLPPASLIWLKATTSADALWSAEQVLRSGSVGGLLFWLNYVRPENLRRLHLAAQAGETLFFVMRPLAAAQDASPAPVRLSLQPAVDGIKVGFVKRRGPQRDEPLFVPLPTFLARRQRAPRYEPKDIPVRVPNPFPTSKEDAQILRTLLIPFTYP